MIVRHASSRLAAAVAVTAFMTGGFGAASASTAGKPLTAGGTWSDDAADFATVAVDPVHHLAYAASTDSGEVDVVNLATGSAQSVTLDGGGEALAIAVDPTSGLAYVPNEADDAVDVLDGGTLDAAIKLPIGDTPRRAVFDPVDDEVYVSDDADQPVSIISGTALAGSVDVGDAEDLAVDDATGDVYVSNASADTVVAIRGSTAIATIKTGSEPGLLAVDPVTDTVWVDNFQDQSITVIANNSPKVTVTLHQPVAGIGVDPASGDAYVAEDPGDPVGTTPPAGVVAILSAAQVAAKVSVAAFPQLPVWDATAGLMIVPSRAGTVTALDGPIVEGTLNLNQSLGSGAVDGSEGRGVVLTGTVYSGGMSVLGFSTPLPGRVVIERPTGSAYGKGQRVLAKFGCSAGMNNSVARCVGSVGEGEPINTATAGTHSFSVTLHEAFGATVRKTVSYRVVK